MTNRITVRVELTVDAGIVDSEESIAKVCELGTAVALDKTLRVLQGVAFKGDVEAIEIGAVKVHKIEIAQ